MLIACLHVTAFCRPTEQPLLCCGAWQASQAVVRPEGSCTGDACKRATFKKCKAQPRVGQASPIRLCRCPFVGHLSAACCDASRVVIIVSGQKFCMDTAGHEALRKTAEAMADKLRSAAMIHPTMLKHRSKECSSTLQAFVLQACVFRSACCRQHDGREPTGCRPTASRVDCMENSWQLLQNHCRMSECCTCRAGRRSGETSPAKRYPLHCL